MRNRLWRRLLEGPRSGTGEDGFTLVELVIATGVILTAVVLLGGVLTAGIKATGFARERQSATGLANQTMEQIRALPFDTMARGLDTTDLANTAGTSDTNVTTTGCGGSYCFGGEQVVNHVNGAIDPLVPHTKTAVVGPSTYTIRSYVTNYQNATTTGTYRVSVFVTWASALSAKVIKAVQVQTIVYTQPNCLSTITHTRSGPCQPAFTSSALADPGSIELSGALGGLSLAHATLWTGRATSDATVEQTWRITGVSQAAGATLQAVGAGDVTVGRASVSSQADNDPGAPGPIYDARTLSSQASGSTALSAGADSITVATTGGDSGSTTSTTAACTSACAPATPSPRNCPSLTGFTNENDNQPCGGSASTSGSSLTANANMSTLGSISLAALGPQLTPTTAIIDRNLGPGTGRCLLTPTSGDGCTWAQLSRSAISMSAGALPSNLTTLLGKPVGFTYFVQMQGIADSVTTEAGKSTGLPAATQSAGSVTVWCAGILGLLCPVTGAVTTAISAITSTVTVPPLTINAPLLGGGTTITLSATITPGSTSKTQVPDLTSCPATCDRTNATATSQPPTVSMQYTIVTGGTTRLNLSYTLDLGAIRAKATYVAAPAS
jgi:hypothetical protein